MRSRPTCFTRHHVGYGLDELQFGELWLPATDHLHPLVILVHGGFWRNLYSLELMNPLAEDLATRGIAVWNVEYRRIGDKGGGWPGTFEDVANALSCLTQLRRTYPFDLARIAAIGHSAGGHLAFWLGAGRRLHEGASEKSRRSAQPRLTGAFSLAGVVDLYDAWHRHLGRDAVVELLGGEPTDVEDRYRIASPSAMLPLGIRQIIIHGTADDQVPLALSEGYVAQAAAHGEEVRLFVLPEVDHFALIDPHSDAWALARRELVRLLGLPRAVD